MEQQISFLKTQTQVLHETLPYLLPLPQAAQRTGLDLETLRKMVAQGKVMAGILPGGEIVVAVQDGQVVMLENGQRQNGLENQATGNGEHEPEGDVFELNRRLAQIRREQFAHLKGQEVGLSEASREFGIAPQVIHRWVKRGYIKVLRTEGRRKFLDKGDVAFCASVYHVRKRYGSRAPLLDSKGNPYLIKYPKLAQARRS